MGKKRQAAGTVTLPVVSDQARARYDEAVLELEAALRSEGIHCEALKDLLEGLDATSSPVSKAPNGRQGTHEHL